MTTKIKLGNIIRDQITGFQGVAVTYSTHINNCPRWSIQPQEVKDGKAVESRSFDEPHVEFVKQSKVSVLPPQRPAEPPELGDTVLDAITGLEGIVISIYIFVAGCARIAVQPRTLKDGLPVEASFVDECNLTVLERANPRAKAARTGGPRPEPVR